MAPHNVLVEDTLTMLTPTYAYVSVGNPHTKAEFIIKIRPTTSNQDILSMIARITNLPLDEFMLVNHKREMWVYPNSRPTTFAVIIARPILRGGVEREIKIKRSLKLSRIGSLPYVLYLLLTYHIKNLEEEHSRLQDWNSMMIPCNSNVTYGRLP